MEQIQKLTSTSLRYALPVVQNQADYSTATEYSTSITDRTGSRIQWTHVYSHTDRAQSSCHWYNYRRSHTEDQAHTGHLNIQPMHVTLKPIMKLELTK